MFGPGTSILSYLSLICLTAVSSFSTTADMSLTCALKVVLYLLVSLSTHAGGLSLNNRL